MAIRALVACAVFVLLLGAILFTSAGTLAYIEAWAALAIVACGVTGLTLYLIFADPQLLQRRLMGGPTHERRGHQRIIQSLNSALFVFLLIASGLDHRFHWSSNTVLGTILGDGLIAAGFLVVFLAFRQNSYAGATIRVEPSQRLCATGPYAHVRHPMYSGALLLIIGLPLALGSWLALLLLPFLVVGVVLRLGDEERFLAKELPGYRDYCARVRHRLVPGLF